MSTLRKYQTNPRNLLSTALNMYKSKRIKTAVVEGVCDRRFLSQWKKSDAPIRFDGFNGKETVEDAYRESLKPAYSKYDFLFFFADVDYDHISNSQLNQAQNFFYNAYCHTKKELHYNDLELFLINSIAFEKVLANHDIDTSKSGDLRNRLEKASRLIGSLRAADITTQRKLGLRSSILNGLNFSAYFDPSEISIDLERLISQIPYYSNYPEHVEDLIEESKLISKKSPTPWALSRGHDVTEMLALHLKNSGLHSIEASRLELMLRIACELSDFKDSPMGQQIISSGAEHYFYP